MTDTCKLRDASGAPARHCEESACVYWRVAGHLGLAESASGCAIQYFELLDGGKPVAEWLLSVKERVERPASDA